MAIFSSLGGAGGLSNESSAESGPAEGSGVFGDVTVGGIGNSAIPPIVWVALAVVAVVYFAKR